MQRFILTAILCFVCLPCRAAEPVAPEFPYQDDPKIIALLDQLQPGQSLVLPRPAAWGDGKNLADVPKYPKYGPVHRDYSNRLVYMPDRHTGFYSGGGHAHRRYNDAWEYHLGSNTWVRLLAPEGGDQGRTKGGWFLCGKLIRTPDAKLSDKEKESLEGIRNWFKEHMTIKDGYVQTKKTGAGFMTSHNWDGMTYDPQTKQILHGAGHAKENDWACYFLLLGEHTPDTFAEKLAEFKQTLRPVTSNMWTFDPSIQKWRKSFHDGPFVNTRQGGAFMTYIPDLKKSLYYHAHGGDPTMMWYDAVKNTWTPVRPNGGAPLGKLIHEQKVAPLQEQQVAYSSKHRKVVAVIDQATHVYDIDKNEWSRLSDDRPMKAHDAKTIFDYDVASDTFLLLRAGRERGEGELYGMSLTDGKWRKITPDGPLPFARWSPGEGFYHPGNNVFVCHTAGSIWVYRHGK